MIYLGNGEIQNIYLGNTPIQGIYAGDLLIYPTTVTGWSVNPSSIKAEKSGGTATIRITSLSAWTISSNESWITFSQNSGESGRTSVIVSFEENETGEKRYATITATDGVNTSTVNVLQYNCQPLIVAQHMGNTNNQGGTLNPSTYLFDSGITSITSCEYDFTGVKQFSHRYWESGLYPNASIGDRGYGCMNSIETFEAYMPDVESINYAFGNDRESNVSQTLTSVTITGTHKLTKLYGFVYYNRNIKKVVLDDLSHLTIFGNGSNPVFNSSNSALTDIEITSLPDINITNTAGFYSLSALSVTSLVNILNALPVTNTSGRYIYLGTTNKNKLSAAQLAIATNKGWTVN